MKSLLLASVVALAATPAFAWDGTNNGNHNQLVEQGPGAQSNSTSTSFSNSSASASNRVVVKPIINVAAPTATSNATAPAADPKVTDPASDPSTHHTWHGGNSHVSGGGVAAVTQVYPAASAFAAPLAGGPCNGSGVSGSAQTAWFGISVAHQRFDYGCAGERMGNLMTLGQKLDWAYQCADDPKFARASASIGLPCPGEEQKPAPAPVAYTPPTKPPAEQALHGTADQYGYCYGAMSVAEKRRHPECG